MPNNQAMAGLKILALTIGASIVYGWAHDLVTANLCVEYFTIGHPDIFGTKNPWLLALGWGAVATWWVGLGLGCLLALAAQIGELPALTWRDLLKPIAILLGMCYVLAFSAGAVVYFGSNEVFGLGSLNISHETDHRFFAVWIIHNASYLLGGVGGLILCGWAIRERVRRARGSSPGIL